ncbi:hypothetical protein GKC56_06290 [Neisseriaceae bacterium PsAf]|nr:hypothetical protein [Neisseriaceae bacterium PsAf]MCV2504108.1 CidA/LrgA family protein [Neisseriaceae bacterium]
MATKFELGIVILLQVVLISLVWLFADWLHQNWITMIPSNILGLIFILVVVSLFEKTIVLFDKGAYFLILHITLLFIPITVLTAEYKELFLKEGINILLVMCLSTIIGMVVVAAVVHYLNNYLNSRKHISEN